MSKAIFWWRDTDFPNTHFAPKLADAAYFGAVAILCAAEWLQVFRPHRNTPVSRCQAWVAFTTFARRADVTPSTDITVRPRVWSRKRKALPTDPAYRQNNSSISIPVNSGHVGSNANCHNACLANRFANLAFNPALYCGFVGNELDAGGSSPAFFAEFAAIGDELAPIVRFLSWSTSLASSVAAVAGSEVDFKANRLG